MNITDLLIERGGIQLDIGCGANKQGADWVGMDMRALPGVDIVHDVNLYPWPLPDGCAVRAICSHLVEHIPPHPPDPRLRKLIELLITNGVIDDKTAEVWLGDWQDGTPRFIRFMDEVWRILKPLGQFALTLPHGYSSGQLQDPSHINASNEATWAYFDPLEPQAGGLLYRIYKPRPWELMHVTWSPAGNMEILMRKRIDDPSYYD